MEPRLIETGGPQRVRFLLRDAGHPLANDGRNVILNLRKHPKRVSSVYVYDKAGTQLFERQCNTPEYYLRRVETQLLRAHAAEIVTRCGFPPIVELGAGTAKKTRILLAEYEKEERRCDYFPIDVDAETLREAALSLSDAFPRLFVHCLGATYARSLEALPACPRDRMFLFLGSSIGNMGPAEIDELLAQLFCFSTDGDHLVLGADLHKDAAIIDRAYNDSAGWGPRSTLNMLTHLNRRYGGNFLTRNFAYRSRYNVHLRRNEIGIESLVDQEVTFSALDFSAWFARSELIDAEVMYKFDPAELSALLERAGFSMVQRWIDPVYRYGLFLLRRQ
jgi:dimethylhistidine N-methyltransferase